MQTEKGVRKQVFEISVPMGKDGFIVAEVQGEYDLPKRVQGRISPMAITSPVYVDANGDGRYRP